MKPKKRLKEKAYGSKKIQKSDYEQRTREGK
jgi:hypothetical protein